METKKALNFPHRKIIGSVAFFVDSAISHFLQKYFSRNTAQVLLDIMTPVLSLCQIPLQT
jgi:hypothetical protein